jgi:Na+/H+-dicarboxylate symporter
VGDPIAYCFLFPLVFPPSETASFLSTSLIEPPAPFDFLGLYIPSNPFHSLATNIVPAVVLFSVILGVGLIGIDRKQVLLDVLGIVSAIIARATRFAARLTPYAIFALSAADAAGRHDQAWGTFVNAWIEMKRRDGTLDTLYHHWILGEAATSTTPRWSVIRNVLHWVD